MLKLAYAGALLRNPTDPFKAALQVVGNSNTQFALLVSQTWPLDSVVIQHQKNLLKEFGEDTFLPGKLETARRIFNLGEDTTLAAKDRLAAYRLYALMRGYITDSVSVDASNTTVINQNKVMIVKDHGKDDEWESAAERQQMRLINDARADE